MIRALLARLAAALLPASRPDLHALPAEEAEQVRQALTAAAAAEIVSDMDVWLLYGMG